MNSQSNVVFRLPDTITYWPWPHRINPHREEVKAASDAWFRSFKGFGPEAQRAFDRRDFSLLAALGCPSATKEHLRTVCDLMALLFAFDEYTDKLPPEVVRQYADVVMDAVRNPIKLRSTDEVVLGAIAQEFWALDKHFVESFEEFVYALVQEAEDRRRCHIRNVEDYFNIRRLTFGSYMVHGMLELSYDLPDKVFNHLTVLALRRLGRDLTILDNDLASYNKEQALEDCPHNIVVCVMNELQCDIHAAISWVEDLHRSTRNRFLTSCMEIPSWGPEIDGIASHYLHGIAN
ncbi:terpenoid synthase [Armillaria gallica]|uniref:Terpene synthase n=1 Tax=Armillaria gallica TaxID=47427 RepID=A0A2H3DUJ8_ARMGA|nr:terpenoid synthase [Armillaria gallica]